MPSLCILAGTPQWLRSRARFRPNPRAEWQFETIDSLKKKVDLSAIWDRVVDVANACAVDGAHIFAFFGERRELDRFAERVAFRHRLVWLQPEDQQIFASGHFQDRMDDLLAFEEEWIRSVKPKDRRSALILPNRAFEAREPLNRIWQRCNRARPSAGETIESLVGQIRGFDKAYHRRGGAFAGVWVDAESRCFKVAKSEEYHTHTVPENNRWKFTWRIPTGFHYDVTDADGRGLKVMDEMGRYQTYRIRANVDPHNYHRGGE